MLGDSSARRGRARQGKINGTAIMFAAHSRATTMEAEHLNAIANAIAGLKDRTAQLRRYL
jgi:hypothetical protein